MRRGATEDDPFQLVAVGLHHECGQHGHTANAHLPDIRAAREGTVIVTGYAQRFDVVGNENGCQSRAV